MKTRTLAVFVLLLLTACLGTLLLKGNEADRKSDEPADAEQAKASAGEVTKGVLRAALSGLRKEQLQGTSPNRQTVHFARLRDGISAARIDTPDKVCGAFADPSGIGFTNCHSHLQFQRNRAWTLVSSEHDSATTVFGITNNQTARIVIAGDGFRKVVRGGLFKVDLPRLPASMIGRDRKGRIVSVNQVRPA